MGRFGLFLLLLISFPARGAESHWAFQKVRHVSPPQVRTPAWVRTPVDAFILARLDKSGLRPAPEADRETLLRRVSFVLTGLPPAPELRRRFLADGRPNAYELLVEELLASPAYGERWAQHWLDVVRFAETNGYEADSLRPHAWRYRDWVVRAFNQDKPYDVFLTEQLAGDLLAKEAEGERRKELLIAAGMHRCGPIHLVGGNIEPEILRQEFLTEVTDAVGSVFLGLTMGCARCHDHKFDPLAQKDYYQLEAFFAGLHPREVDIATDRERAEHSRQVKEIHERIGPLRKQIADIDAPHRARLTKEKTAKLEPPYREALATEVSKRTPEQHKLFLHAQILLKVTWDEVLAVLPSKDAARRADLRRQLHEWQARLPPPPAQAWTLAEGKLTPSHVLKRGDVQKKGERVEAGLPRVLAEVCQTKESRFDRLALARWLTRPDHPLTARVMVNRVWQHHFGRGLVGTPGDFGTRGEAPSHPELLDWLARALMRPGESAWSLKHLQRLLVLSSTFRQDSNHRDAKAVAVDVDNRLLWRMNRLRLDAETLRDAMLAVSGELNRGLGGPPVRVPLEPEVYDLIFTEDEPDGLWPVTPEVRQHARRTLYLLRKRNVRLPLLEAFDQPDSLIPCARRSVSTFAPQALILLNGPFAQEQSRALERRLVGEGDAERRVRRAFELTLAREPRPAELTAALEFLAAKGALADLCLALLNRNEFLYVR